MPRSRKFRYSPRYRVLLRLLTEARNKASVTQAELAVRMTTSQSMLSKLERGVVRMDLTDLLDYLEGIGTDPIEFIRLFLKQPPPETASDRTKAVRSRKN